MLQSAVTWGVAAALAAATGFAHAQSRVYAYEAELAQGAKRATVTAGGVRWSCTGTRCTASGRGGNVSVRGCSELARAVGPVARYQSEIRQLADADLRECNRLAQAPAAASAKAAKGPAKPQRATTAEIRFTGIAPSGAPAQLERKP
jgi:hypothetical protein